MDPHDIGEEMRRAQAEFHQLIAIASHDDLHRSTHGTRWTNRQLLFHKVLGYGVVRILNTETERSLAAVVARR